MARKIAAGNWKMNGQGPDLAEARAIGAAASQCDVVLCPPATLLERMSSELSQSEAQTGGQDCHTAANGAHTGDLAAAMLKEAGANYVILGHSERRADHNESDELVSAKVSAAWANDLTAIVCVGETESERDAGQTLDVVGKQLAGSIPEGADGGNTVIAYEPVWAIGTGRTATPLEIAEVHADIRAKLASRFGASIANAIPILYGGSVKAGNAAEIFAVENVDGALVGGASLKASDFVPIIEALSSA